MQAQTVQGVIAITILRITTHRISHVGSMYTYLVLTSRLQLKLHQRVIGSAVKNVEMGDSQFATIIERR